MSKAITAIFLIIVGIVLIGIGPVATILAINQLFGTVIEVNFTSWLAMLWLQLLLVPKNLKS